MVKCYFGQQCIPTLIRLIGFNLAISSGLQIPAEALFLRNIWLIARIAEALEAEALMINQLKTQLRIGPEPIPKLKSAEWKRGLLKQTPVWKTGKRRRFGKRRRRGCHRFM
ncbi:hypothetical protein CEXT_309581 [Caerostris extrusa]|uniref:Uncharacterized protein n=1 Tax=Caerostris extrusa TaxID=172846 RepID=A0AAV4NHT9_CAEEX|nr:hypothetical protein CEXT_309581 [Caerostris extrusa]